MKQHTSKGSSAEEQAQDMRNDMQPSALANAVVRTIAERMHTIDRFLHDKESKMVEQEVSQRVQVSQERIRAYNDPLLMSLRSGLVHSDSHHGRPVLIHFNCMTDHFSQSKQDPSWIENVSEDLAPKSVLRFFSRYAVSALQR